MFVLNRPKTNSSREKLIVNRKLACAIYFVKNVSNRKFVLLEFCGNRVTHAEL